MPQENSRDDCNGPDEERGTAPGFYVALLHVMEDDMTERVSLHGLLAGTHAECVTELARAFPHGRWSEGADAFVIEDWIRKVRLHPVALPGCPCGHAWERHDVETGECEAHVHVHASGAASPCPCGRDLEHHQAENARHARMALKRLAAARTPGSRQSAPATV
jgi:hypothetical protein